MSAALTPSWVSQLLLPMQFVCGVKIPMLTPLQYCVIFTLETSSPEQPSVPIVKFRSQFFVSCGCASCFTWCCENHCCSGEKDLYDLCVASSTASGEHTLELLSTTAFGQCGVCCGCEKGKIFHVFQSVNNKYTVLLTGSDVTSNLPAGGECFVCSPDDKPIADADRAAIVADIVQRKWRQPGFALDWPDNTGE